MIKFGDGVLLNMPQKLLVIKYSTHRGVGFNRDFPDGFSQPPKTVAHLMLGMSVQGPARVKTAADCPGIGGAGRPPDIS